MQTSKIADMLDQEFRVQEVGDAYLAQHALSEVSRAVATEAFLAEKSGLLFNFAQEIDKVYSVVFATTEVLDCLLQVIEGPSLLFTHHPHDYHEDARGFGPFPEDYLVEFKRNQIAVYAIHAPLDVGLNICVSKSLAERLSLSLIPRETAKSVFSASFRSAALSAPSRRSISFGMSPPSATCASESRAASRTAESGSFAAFKRPGAAPLIRRGPMQRINSTRVAGSAMD